MTREAKAGPRPLTTAERVAFVAALRARGELRAAAGEAGIDHRRVYALRKTDAELASAIEIAREAWRARVMDEIATTAATPTPAKPAGDWQGLAYLLDKHDARREGAAKLALLRAQTRQAELRNAGTLPAEKIELSAKADDELLERLTRLAGGGAGPAGAGGGADGG